MKHSLVKFLCLLSVVLASTAAASAQVGTGFGSTGSVAGVVLDQSGGVVPGAEISVKNMATNLEYSAVTAENGTFLIPSVPSGLYSVTVTMPGFKQAIVNDVKVDVGTPASVRITVEAGAPTESVIVTGAAQIIQTQTANISTTITGRQIVEIPFVSRDALDLVLLLPGTATPGRPRTSSVNGLPKGSLNITIDGLNVQDNLLKSSDGFFTYIRPRLDAIEEVSLSTATPGAESAGEGAVQIKFVTRGGDNEFHGSLYEYHRNPVLNANFWYNNRDKAPDPKTGKAPKDRILLNQFGVRVGGPIRIPGLFDGRDKAFFFVNYEEYRLPEQYTRDRTILTQDAQTGIFKYGSQSVNLFALATANNQTATADPTIGALLAAIRASTSQGALRTHSDPNYQYLTFTNTGGQTRRFPTVRFDFNFTENHHLENIWNYQAFGSKMDFLNSADPRFPGFENYGSQGGPRWSNVTALRSTLTPTLINEARFGLSGGLTVWFPEIGPGSFGPGGGYALNITVPGIDNWYATNSPQRRNSPVKQFSDTLSWIRGTHTLNFGFNLSQINLFNKYGAAVASIDLGVDATDPANSMFSAQNFPNSSSADRSRAAGLYALLTGRVTAINATAYLDEITSKYAYLGRRVERAQMRETGLFFQDSWRWKPNLTVNYGLRWEVQYPFTALNNAYSTTSFEELWGISGAGNIFKPGTLTGKETQFVAFEKGQKSYNIDYKNFSPSLGLAWSPNFKNSVLRRIFGTGTQSVIRAGYSIASNREGTNVFSAILGSNPGGSISATRNMTLGNLVGGALGSLPLLFREKDRLGPPTVPTTPTYPMTGVVTNSVNVFDPNLRLGYIQSWSLGIQRELSKDTVFEVRYVGNKGTALWRQYDINETNVVENKFIDEFKLAMANLQANNAAGGSRANSFAYFGAGTGTSPLPMILAHFSAKPAAQAGDAALYTSSNFKSSSFYTYLFPDAPGPQAFANLMVGNATMRANAGTAGLPANLFRVNPGKLGGAYIVDNGGMSRYNALAVEVRRRMSKGLLIQGSYNFSKALTNMWASSSSVYSGYSTLRYPQLNKTVSPFNIRHAFKANWIYELPFGKGKLLLSDANRVVNGFLGGWEFHGAARIQSGGPVNLGNVSLVGMTQEDLQKRAAIRQDDAAKITYWLPQDIIDNTRRAFNVTASGYSTLGVPTGQYIAPASNRDCMQTYGGQCGFSNLILYGPPFVRFDLSAVKRVDIWEQVNFELRAEFLNAFNFVNFMAGSPASDVNNIGGFSGAAFGQTRNAYQDLSTTNDPGGRLIQIVLRLNF